MHKIGKYERNMKIQVHWNADVTRRFPALSICVGAINNVCNEKANDRIQELSRTVYELVRAKYNVETLKNDPTVRAYRDFYWKLNIDPTKTRPASEALLRRVLHGYELPSISTVVDAYNLASMKTIIPISGFNSDRLNPPFQVRFATNGEVFTGIDMSKPATLTDKTLVLTDEKQVLCVYPYRDSDHSKITLQTHNVLIIAYGSPGITEKQLRNAVETSLSYIEQTSQGEITMTKVFSTTNDETS
ncbi:MAG: phenylalanine--tRNA ligase beta subunit-related protein [Candidatus Bathyarchaeia archaeon]